MAKKTQRRPSRNGRDQAGCISGLISSIFDFRQGRSTKRLLSDRSRANNQVNGFSGHSINRSIESHHGDIFDSIEDPEDNEEPMYDMPRRSVKKLMEEEMITDSDLSSEQDNSNHWNLSKKNNHTKNRAGGNKSNDIDASELYAERDHTEMPSKAFDLMKLVEGFVRGDQMMKIRTKKGSNGELKTPSNKAATTVEDSLVSAVQLILEQKIGKKKSFVEEEQEESSEFIDALAVLNSNRGLFLKLLEDPNSTLVKQIEHLEDNPSIDKDGQAPSFINETNLPEESANSIKPDDSRIKHLNFFRRRRTKSLGNDTSVDEVGDSQSLNRIVVLKPGPGGLDGPEISTAAKKNTSSRFSDVDSKVLFTRHASHFSFTEIKRRLKHVMGKDSSPGNNTTNKSASPKSSPKKESSNLGWSSPNRNHFYTERFMLPPTSLRKGERVCKSNELSLSPRIVGSNIYAEAKKHLSEILSNGEENMGSVSGQFPKPLGRILCLPSYSQTPCSSPRKWVGEISVTTTPTRLSPRAGVKNDTSVVLKENHDDHPRDSLNSMKINAEVSGTDDQDCLGEIQSSTAEEERMMEFKNEEEEKIASISCESYNRSTTEEDDEEESALICSEVSSQRLKLDSSEEDRHVHSPDYAHEKMERPSPISILEPLFTDDEISPQRVTPQPDEVEIKPCQIHFEEQSPPPDEQTICTRISLEEEEESAFEYVEAVLLGSGLNWDEFIRKWLSCNEILDPSLFEEVGSFSGQSLDVQKLLFDCANEALKEICQKFFGCFTGIPCLKQTKSKQVIPRGMDLINEVWDRVEKIIASNAEHLSFDQLVRRDLTMGPTEWVDLRSDAELVGAEVEDAIFSELVEETVLSFEAIRFENAIDTVPARCKAKLISRFDMVGIS